MTDREYRKHYTRQGYNAFNERQSHTACPYRYNGEYHKDKRVEFWMEGWLLAAGLLK